MRESIRRALKNIATYGDTDIFPFPFERHIFHDEPDRAKEILLEMHAHFEEALAQNPPAIVETLLPVGYTGFRWATQIEPFWNAYYLALVIELADGIELLRSPRSANQVYSYRFEWDEESGKLFAPTTWIDYRKRSKELAGSFAFVVTTDIADFYSRIYHHRLENALHRIGGANDTTNKIIRLLQNFSANDSYGLPVGGPASRMLAELAIADVDRHLNSKGITFCRYADDYAIFANSREDAYRALVFLADKLFNEGLALQKQKSRIVTKEEFLATLVGLNPALGSGNEADRTDEEKLLGISVRYDPYSPTAAEDYAALKASLAQIDIVGILGREVRKSAIDQAVTRQAIAAVGALPQAQQLGAIRTLLDPENIQVLAPVFVSVLRLVRGIYTSLPAGGKQYVDSSLSAMYHSNSFLLSLEIHQAFFVQALAQERSSDKEQILVDLYERTTSSLVRRQIILSMVDLDATYWLRDKKLQYVGLTDWEKRALLISSYFLGDEGRHWRHSLRNGLTASQKLTRDWFARRVSQNRSIPH